MSKMFRCIYAHTRLSRQKRTIYARVHCKTSILNPPRGGYCLYKVWQSKYLQKRFRNAIAMYIYISIQTTHLTPNYPNLPHCLLSMYPRRHIQSCTDFNGGIAYRRQLKPAVIIRNVFSSLYTPDLPCLTQNRKSTPFVSCIGIVYDLRLSACMCKCDSSRSDIICQTHKYTKTNIRFLMLSLCVLRSFKVLFASVDPG